MEKRGQVIPVTPQKSSLVFWSLLLTMFAFLSSLVNPFFIIVKKIFMPIAGLVSIVLCLIVIVFSLMTLSKQEKSIAMLTYSFCLIFLNVCFIFPGAVLTFTLSSIFSVATFILSLGSVMKEELKKEHKIILFLSSLSLLLEIGIIVLLLEGVLLP